MAQEVFKLGKTQSNMFTPPQPLGDMANEGETTYTKDSGRVKTGKVIVKPMFTVEQYSLAWEGINKTELAQIMNIIKKGKKLWIHYFSTTDGAWVTKQFYCGKYSTTINTLKNGEELFDLSFNVEGVNPVE